MSDWLFYPSQCLPYLLFLKTFLKKIIAMKTIEFPWLLMHLSTAILFFMLFILWQF